MMWYPQAIVRPGPAWKLWADTNSRRGAILHSAEGYEGGLWSQLDGPAQVSWHFSILQNGDVLQHFGIDQSPWHAGNKAGNTSLIGIEHEGITGEPLTPPQLNASRALVRWLADECGWTASRQPGRMTLFEHREINPQTTCPNGRIPWVAYEEDEVRAIPLDQAETLEAFNQLAKRLGGVMFDDEAEEMERVIDPPPPPGYGRVVVTYKL